MPRLPLHVRLAGAAPLAPAALLPVSEFAGISEADTYWSTRKQRLNYVEQWSTTIESSRRLLQHTQRLNYVELYTAPIP